MSESTSREALIPSYVRDCNDAAARAGIEVAVLVNEDRNESLGIDVTWLGSAAQFDSLKMRICDTNDWRRIASGGRSGRISTGYFRCDATREGEDTFSLYARYGLPLTHFVWRGINAYTFASHYSDETEYHGTPDVLIEAGLLQRKQIPIGLGPAGRFHRSRRGGDGGSLGDGWVCELCFDGKIIFTRKVSNETAREWSRQQELSPAQRAAIDARRAEYQAQREQERIERKLLDRGVSAARHDDSFQAFMRRLQP